MTPRDARGVSRILDAGVVPMGSRTLDDSTAWGCRGASQPADWFFGGHFPAPPDRHRGGWLPCAAIGGTWSPQPLAFDRYRESYPKRNRSPRLQSGCPVMSEVQFLLASGPCKLEVILGTASRS